MKDFIRVCRIEPQAVGAWLKQTSVKSNFQHVVYTIFFRRPQKKKTLIFGIPSNFKYHSAELRTKKLCRCAEIDIVNHRPVYNIKTHGQSDFSNFSLYTVRLFVRVRVEIVCNFKFSLRKNRVKCAIFHSGRLKITITYSYIFKVIP
jgi:hypothetical protein